MRNLKSFIGILASNSTSRLIQLNTVYLGCRLVQVRTVSNLSVPCAKCHHGRFKFMKETFTKQSNICLYRQFSGLKKLKFGDLGRTFSTVSDHDLDLFPLRFIYVRTNISVWEEYPEGLQFDVGYVDTKLRKDGFISDRKPVILGLPSSVGDHTELLDILLTFAKLGYRVVIPNLPGTSFCRGKRKRDEAVCQFSTQEKADFVKDFLKELGISKVDMLITNSCSVYTGVSLCVFHAAMFKSLVMLNPTGLEATQSMLPLWLHERFTKVFDERYVLQGLFKGLAAGVKKFTKKSDWETINVVTYSRTIAALSFKDERVRTEYLKTRVIPRFAIFGEDSENFETKSTLEYLSLLDIPESAISEMNEQNKLVKKGTPFNGNYGLYIKGDSGDDILQTRTVVLRKELLKILKTVCTDL